LGDGVIVQDGEEALNSNIGGCERSCLLHIAPVVVIKFMLFKHISKIFSEKLSGSFEGLTDNQLSVVFHTPVDKPIQKNQCKAMSSKAGARVHGTDVYKIAMLVSSVLQKEHSLVLEVGIA
jgi:hypothetical protein